MLIARRLADLQITTQKLRSIKRNALQASAFRAGGGRPGELGNQTVRMEDGILRRNLSQVARQQGNRSSEAQREKLLFRKVPLLLSLVERSIAHLEKKQGLSASLKSSPTLVEGGAPQEAPVKQLTSGSFWSSQWEDGNALLREANVEGRSLELVQPFPNEPLHIQRQSKSYHIIVVSQILRLLNYLEDERHQLYREKMQSLAYKNHMTAANYDKFRHDFEKQLRQQHKWRTKRNDMPLKNEDAALLQETEQQLQEQIRHCREDMDLLKKSVLARPYLSAAMWKQLLKNRIWLPFLTLREEDYGLPSSSSSDGGDRTEEQLILFEMVTALVRVCFGTLHSYVAEGSDISRRSPRFVVSLPSSAYRARHKALTETGVAQDAQQLDEQKETQPFSPAHASEELGGDAASDDLLMDMLSGNADDHHQSTAEVSRGSKKKQRKMARPVLREVRWMPTHASEVLTLTIETLALVSFLLPVLDVTLLLSQNLRAAAGNHDGGETTNVQLLLQLMIRVQKMALVVLSLRSDQPSAAGDRNTHTVLHRLEKELVELGLTLKYELLQAVEEATVNSNVQESVSQLGLLLQRTSPSAAARMLIEMESLHLVARPFLHADEEARTSSERKRAVDESLVSHFALLVFPSLKTNTRQALQRKGADSLSTSGTQSLFAFTTKNHRKKLLKRFNNNKGQVESYLLGTIVQQNRLHQRMLSAALHKNYVDKMIEQVHLRLGQELTRLELVSLFQLFCSFAAVQHQEHFGGGIHLDGTSNNNNNNNNNMLLTAALCTSEAILLNGIFASPEVAKNADGTPLTHGNAFLFSLNDLTKMWSSLVVLTPIVHERHEAARESQRFARSVGAGFQTTETQKENQIVHFLLMEILSSINELVAAHVKQCRANITQAARKNGKDGNGEAKEAAVGSLTAVHVTQLVSSLQSWTEHRGTANRGFRDVEEQVQLLVRLLKEALIHDTTLRREVRSLPLEQRERFEKLLLDSFQSADALDTTLMQALETMCYRL